MVKRNPDFEFKLRFDCQMAWMIPDPSQYPNTDPVAHFELRFSNHYTSKVIKKNIDKNIFNAPFENLNKNGVKPWENAPRILILQPLGKYPLTYTIIRRELPAISAKTLME